MLDSIEYGRVADLYDSYVQVNFDVPFFIEEARKVRGEILELMSGTGRVSVPLVEAGARLTCIDRSPEMLAMLRAKLEERGLQAAVHAMDIRDLTLPARFELAFIAFHSFAELLNPEDQRQVLERIHAQLVEGGRLIITLHNPAVRLKPVDGQLHLWGRYPLKHIQGRLLFWGLQEYHRETRQVSGLQIYEEYDARGVMQARRLMEFNFYLFQKREFEELAQSTGFWIEALYGDYTRAPYDEQSSPFMIFALGKK